MRKKWIFLLIVCLWAAINPVSGAESFPILSSLTPTSNAYLIYILGRYVLLIHIFILWIVWIVYYLHWLNRNQIIKKIMPKQCKIKLEIKEKNDLLSQNFIHGDKIRNSKFFAALNELMKDELVYTQPHVNRKAISDMLNTNEKYLFDSIKQNTGLSFSEYINDLRLNLAKELLSGNNNYTIEDIAIRAGFGSRTTFHRQFRKKYNVSPAEFRKTESAKYNYFI